MKAAVVRTSDGEDQSAANQKEEQSVFPTSCDCVQAGGGDRVQAGSGNFVRVGGGDFVRASGDDFVWRTTSSAAMVMQIGDDSL